MAFLVSSSMNNGIAQVTLVGELDGSVAGDFKNAVEAAAALNPRRLVLLLQELTYMSSAGLRVLVFARQKMGAHVDLYLVAPQESVQETIEMTGFDQSCIIVDTYDAAVIEAF
jgi:anti-anti-sigma factor